MAKHRETRRRPGRRRTLAVLLGAATGLVAAQAVGTSAAAAAPVGCTAADLVTALTGANASNGTITLTAGCTYTLTAENNHLDEPTGLPNITGTVTINGNGATITRSAAPGTPAFRLLDVLSGGSLTLSNVTLSNGLANQGVAGSNTIGGGAVHNAGTLTVTGVTFRGNRSPGSSGSSGGAIDSAGTLTVLRSVFDGNVAQEGGGFLSQGATTIRQSTFRNNQALEFGGGAFVTAHGTTNVYDSTFVGNLATDVNGNTAGGGAIDNDDTVNVYNSTFTANQGGSKGGGAIQNFGTMTIVQSTIAGNIAGDGASLHNVDQINDPNTITATMTVSQSIVDNPQSGQNCGGTATGVVDGGYNISSDASCNFSAANHSLVNTDPGLQALADNGGPTQTMAVTAGSPAVDAVPTAACASNADQRGVTRPQGAGCDIGAYEYAPPPPVQPTPPPTQPAPPPVQPSSPFFDVPQNSPFLADIQWLFDEKITTGYADGGFHPDAPVTRGAMAAYLYRYAHGGTDGGACTGTAPFPDIAASGPFCADIAWLETAKITNGYADGMFHPELPVSREAIAAFLYRFANGGDQATACTTPSPFSDVAQSYQFCTAIQWLTTTTPEKISNGYADGMFHPLDATSRQAMAAYLHRYDTDYHGYGTVQP